MWIRRSGEKGDYIYCNEYASRLLTYIIPDKSAEGVCHLTETSEYSCIKFSKLANIIAS